MTYSQRNMVEDKQEACLKAKQITELCQQLNIPLDPINWQDSGMRAPVSVNQIEIAPLMELGQRDPDDLLRHFRIRLLEHAAIRAVHARPGAKALMWTPVDVVQPQDFLSLWVITLDNDERVAIAESIQDGQRVYRPYHLLKNDPQQLAKLFGSANTGEYQLGEQVSIKERDRQYSGEILYIIPPGKNVPTRKYAAKGYHTIAGTTYTNDVAPRYVVDCHDGFPHIVNQSQITR